MADSTWLVVGLGNPGPRYAANRHNVGQMVVDELARRRGVGLRAHKSGAAVAETRIGASPGGEPGGRVVLVKPSSYMNASGRHVAAVSQFFKIPPADTIVVHDELDLPFGTIKLKRGGGEGGHNGLRDVTRTLGTRDYVRVRVGIGRPPGRMDPADFVLRDFAPVERKELPFVLADAADAAELIVLDGLERAQLEVHSQR